MFIQNTRDVPITVPKVPPGIDLLNGRWIADTLQLDTYGCAVIRLTA